MAHKTRIGLRNRTIGGRFTICARFVDQVAKAPEERRRGVRLTELQQKRAAAEELEQTVQKLKTKLKAAITERNQALAAYCREVDEGATCVALCAGCDADVLACGVGLAEPKRAVGVAGAPTHLRPVPVEADGAVKLRWKRPVRRCVFFIEMTTDPQAKHGWIRIVSSAATRVIEGLQPGVLYWFRVCAFNSAGQGPWSQSIAVRPAH